MKKTELIAGYLFNKYCKLAIFLFSSIIILSSILYAGDGDTDIFRKSYVPPNVMIIIDTSGSMDTKDVRYLDYNPNTDYTSSVPSGKIIYRKNDIYLVPQNGKVGDTFTVFVTVTDQTSQSLPSLPSFNCTGAEDSLRDQGRWTGMLFGSNRECCEWYNFCTGDARDLRRGNYLNYQYAGASATGKDSRINVVRKVVSNAVRSISGVRWGLMRYNSGNSAAENRLTGGKILAECGTSPDKILRIINEKQATPNPDFDLAFKDSELGAGWRNGTATPSSTVMADAGLYFANKRCFGGSKLNSGYFAPYDASAGKGMINTYKDQRYDTLKGSYADPMNFDLKGDGTLVKYSCQKNYIIFISDGQPNYDTGDYDGKIFNLWKNTYINGVGNNRAIHPNRSGFSQCYDRDCDHDGTCGKNKCGTFGECNILYSNNKPQNANNYLDYDGDGCDPTPCNNEGEKNCWKVGQTQEEQCSSASDGLCSSEGGTHYLDDVAYYLHNNDIRTDIPGTQNVTIYTIGLRTSESDLLNGPLGEPLLQKAAIKGGGTYNAAGDADRLQDLFHIVAQDIMNQNATFVAPVVPVSENKLYSGDAAYFAYFRPTLTGNWEGNLKKYKLINGHLASADGTILEDSNGRITITNTTRSCWSDPDVPDGSDVMSGGLKYVLNNGNESKTRRYFTHIYPSQGSMILSSSNNSFSVANNLITNAVIGADSTNMPGYGDYNLIRDKIINYASYQGQYSVRSPILGDIIHSRPAIFNDWDADKKVILFGSNDGMLHCVIDDVSSATEKAWEEWNYIPWQIMPKIRKLHPEYRFTAETDHYYFVDASPTIYKVKQDSGDSSLFATFGQRRGGGAYMTLDIGSYISNPKGPDTFNPGYTYDKVKFVWEYRNDFLTTSSYASTIGETLGMSWGKPYFCKYKTGPNPSDYLEVLVMAGGYDQVNEDTDPPPTTYVSPKGRALYVLNAKDGSLASAGSPLAPIALTAKNFPYFTHSITDFSMFDYNSDSFSDSIYIGDLNGNVFALKDRDANGSWDWEYILKRSNITGTANMNFKVFYAPDVVLFTGYEYVYWGTGDREHPSNTSTVNRFYAVKNTWSSSNVGNPNSPVVNNESELLDVTAYANTQSVIPETLKGWFIKLNLDDSGTPGTVNTGEKMVSSPIVYDGVIYFTTYIPYIFTAADICSTNNDGKTGSGRLYALDYLTGKSVFDLDRSGDKENLTESDRFISLGDGMPTAPTLVSTNQGMKILLATAEAPSLFGASRNRFRLPNMRYWKQN